PAMLVAALEEPPDHRVVLVRHGVVGVLPIHPVAQAPGLLRLDRREAPHALLAPLDEPVDAERLDVPLRPEPQLLLDLDLHPEPLAVEAVLVAGLEALHRLVTVPQILVGPSPGMVDAH